MINSKNQTHNNYDRNYSNDFLRTFRHAEKQIYKYIRKILLLPVICIEVTAFKCSFRLKNLNLSNSAFSKNIFTKFVKEKFLYIIAKSDESFEWKKN